MQKHLILLSLGLTVVLGVLGLAAGLSVLGELILTSLFGADANTDILLWSLVLAGLLLPRDWLSWNRPCRIVGQAVIDGTPGRIWDEVMPRTRNDYYLSGISRVDTVPDDPSRFLFHRRQEDGAGADPLQPLEVQIASAEHSRYLNTRILNREAMPFWGQDLISSEVFIRRMPDGQVGVMIVETLERLRLPVIVALLVVNPCRDAALALKARVEGRGQVSWLGRVAGEMISGGGLAQIVGSGRRSVAMAAGVTVAVVSGIFYWLASWGGPF